MNKYKKLLLDNLKNDVYCRIGRSNIHGVGVIAIKNIPKGTNPFLLTNKKCIKYNCVQISDEEINGLSPGVKRIIFDFIAPHNRKYCIPFNGPNSLDISFYMNHSNDNNIDIIDNGCEFIGFIANKNIKIGEELTINYDDFL